MCIISHKVCQNITVVISITLTAFCKAYINQCNATNTPSTFFDKDIEASFCKNSTKNNGFKIILIAHLSYNRQNNTSNSLSATANSDHLGLHYVTFGEHGRTPLARTVKCFTVACHTPAIRPLTVNRTEPDQLGILMAEILTEVAKTLKKTFKKIKNNKQRKGEST